MIVENLFNKTIGGLELLINNLIRPERRKYDPSELQIDITGVALQNYQILNSRDEVLRCSWYYSKHARKSVVIYLHGNSSCRLEGACLLRNILNNDFQLFVFDFAGCGLSQGEIITLGAYESQDIKQVIQFVKSKSNEQIFLWGRSMGAVATIRYLSQKHQLVSAALLDSPFSDLQHLAIDFIERIAPKIFSRGVLKLAKVYLRRKLGFSIFKPKPKDIIKNVRCPLMFLTTNVDSLVDSQHTKLLHRLFTGKKHIQILQRGDHNSKRPQFSIEMALSFFKANQKQKLQNYQSEQRQPCRKTLTSSYKASMPTEVFQKLYKQLQDQIQQESPISQIQVSRYSVSQFLN